jgi:hypothetical protein
MRVSCVFVLDGKLPSCMLFGGNQKIIVWSATASKVMGLITGVPQTGFRLNL